MGWLFYLIGIVLLFADAGGWGILSIVVGMLFHWKFWFVTILAGVAAFVFVRD